MQIQNYVTSLNKIVLFCNSATDGFVVVEINNLRKKKTLLYDLQKKFNVNICTLSQIEHHDINSETVKKEIILIDETFGSEETQDSENFAINLNYNRDWLSRLNKVIVFFMPSWKVNKIITYSNSFWSFVSLHVCLNEKNNCVLTPHYVREEAHLFYSDETIQRKRQLHKTLYKTSLSNLEIAEISTNNNTIFSYEMNIVDFLDDVLNNIKKSSKSSVESFIKDVMHLAEFFCYEKKLKKAKQCYHFLVKRIDFSGKDLFSIRNEIYFSLAYVYYEDKEYIESLRLLNFLNQELEKNISAFSNYEIAMILNNIGVNLYMIDKSNVHIPLEAINESIDAINWEDETSFLGDILFNASLFAYMSGDHDKAQYYIQLAISIFERYSNRTYKILVARYKILQTFILLNEGNFQKSLDNMKQSIYYLREELQEDHLYVLEAHYVNSLLFYYLDELEKAYTCIVKAINISKRIKCTLNMKVHIWALYGFILHEIGELNEAKKYLDLAHRRGKTELSNDILCHINEIISL